MKCFKVILILFSLAFCNCRSQNDNIVKIDGFIDGLPNGTMYLVNVPDRTSIIDSTSIMNGKFKFNLRVSQSKMFSYATIIAKDQTMMTREFAFPTNKLFKGKQNNVDFFLLENNVVLRGGFTDFTSKNFNLGEKNKLEILHQPVKGKQSWVAYNVDLDFSRLPDDKLSYQKLKDTLTKYSYSYFLLKELSKNVTIFDKGKLSELLNLYSEEMKLTPLWITMNSMTKGKIKNKSIKDFKLTDPRKERQSVLDTNSGHLNVLVFWASWCVPCLEEIPDLKEFYNNNKYNKKINIVSISSDKDENKWLEKLKQENMPWKQLIISSDEEKNEIYYAFKLNSTIPVTVLADDNGNVISKFYGYDQSESIKLKLDKVLKINKK